MRLLLRVQDGLLTVLALIGALAIITLMLHVVTDVVLRNTVNAPIPATYEIVTHYYMIAAAFIPPGLGRTGWWHGAGRGDRNLPRAARPSTGPTGRWM